MTTNDLGTHLGSPIIRTRVAVSNAGDGLSKAKAIDPEVLGRDTEHVVLLRCSLKGHRLEWVEDEDNQIAGWELTNQLRAGLATIVPADRVADVFDLLDDQQRKLDEAAGVVRLPLGDGSASGEPGSDAILPGSPEAAVQSAKERIERRRKSKKGEEGLTTVEDADGQRASG